MTNTVLVTCLYNVKYTELIGGRGYPINTYFPSLQSIFAIKLPVILYTSEKDVEILSKFLQESNYDNYEIRTHDLTTYRHYAKILAAKETHVNPAYRYYHRCEVLCHTKLHFLEQAYTNKWGCKKVVWVDAGITENSKVPIKYGGRELGEGNVLKRYEFSLYPNNPESLFKPELGTKLDEYVEKHKWFFVTLNAPFDGYNSPWLNILNKQAKILCGINDITNAKWVVGTLWGGYKEHFDEIYSIYNKMVDNTIDEQLFPKTEEMYLGVINSILKKHSLYFDTWYPDVPGEMEYMTELWKHNPNLKSFYKIFKDILE